MRLKAALFAVFALTAATGVEAGRESDPAPVSAAETRRALTPAFEKRDVPVALGLLRMLAEQGFALSRPTRGRFAEFLPTDEMAAIDARFEANAAPLVASSTRYVLPEALKLVEGIAHDPKTGTLYFATVAGRALWALDKDRLDAVPLPAESGSLFGLGLDADRRVLWMASGVAEPTPAPEAAFRGLIGLDLTGKAGPWLVPIAPKASPADLLVLPDGTVIVADGQGGGLYRCLPQCTALEPLVPASRLKSPQGMALSADGKSLIVADYGSGLWRVPMADPDRMSLVVSARPAMLDGLDGLVGHRDRIIAIQNGTQPRRILSLRLSRDGKRLEELVVLERLPTDAGEPTLGTVIGREFLYVADSQWEIWDKGGNPKAGMKPRPTAIRVLALD